MTALYPSLAEPSFFACKIRPFFPLNQGSTHLQVRAPATCPAVSSYRPDPSMSNQNRASSFKQNVVPKRMDGYVDRRDLERYLTDRWPNVELKEFKIRASAQKQASDTR